MKDLLAQEEVHRSFIIDMICDKLAILQSQHLLRTFVWILGTVNIKGQYAQKDQAENCLNAIKKALGPLPLVL